ncbi:MAG: hypothetical protein LBJ78_02030 [Puniceicoccales bacterium]|nr:hypothetical protein [Puniceicoccales bacterium]
MGTNFDTSSTFNASAASALGGENLGASESSSVSKTGNLGGDNVIASNDVDPSTKDDEMGSEIQSKKDATEAKIKEGKRNKGTSAASRLEKPKESEKLNEQNKDVRRRSKEAELRQKSQARLGSHVSDRSGKLFDDEQSREKYEKYFNALDELSIDAPPSEFLKKVSGFTDVAEQHNALQVARQSWTEELAYLQGRQIADNQNPGHHRSVQGELNEVNAKLDALGKDSSKLSTKEGVKEKETLEAERDAISGRIKDLEAKLATLNKASGHLMDTQGARIDDSYRLAPELRKYADASPNKSLNSTPKDLNAIILDEILPSGKDMNKMFDVVVNKFLNDPSNRSTAHSQIERFTANVWLIEQALTSELNNLKVIDQYGDSKDISKAIMDAIQGMRELASVCASNESMLQSMQKAQRSL